ncbi:MAG: molecular chaperone TorD family protein [Thermomicrobiales bacterium]|nr:molecular chaperone TorD family protein [Thermomicrobiales bacterium]
MIGAIARDNLRCFADMLEYPAPSLPGTVNRCRTLLAAFDTDAADALVPFADYVARTPLPLLEEAYTGIFDLDPKCHLYIGYHLFGDSYKRSAFLIGLKERFSASGFSVGDELPDHLSAMLRFVAMTTDAIVAQELIDDALLPSLERMTDRNPSAAAAESATEALAPPEPRPGAAYIGMLDALRMVLERASAAGGANTRMEERSRDLALLDGRKGA